MWFSSLKSNGKLPFFFCKMRLKRNQESFWKPKSRADRVPILFMGFEWLEASAGVCGSEQLEGGDELPGAGHLVSPDPPHLDPGAGGDQEGLGQGGRAQAGGQEEVAGGHFPLRRLSGRRWEGQEKGEEQGVCEVAILSRGKEESVLWRRARPGDLHLLSCTKLHHLQGRRPRLYKVHSVCKTAASKEGGDEQEISKTSTSNIKTYGSSR